MRPCSGQELFELAVGTELGRHEADGAVGQALGGTHVRHCIAKCLLHEREELLDRGIGLTSRSRFGVGQCNERQVRRALA